MHADEPHRGGQVRDSDTSTMPSEVPTEALAFGSGFSHNINAACQRFFVSARVVELVDTLDLKSNGH